MSAEYLVRYCSPTLAGIKIGNLFSCRFDSLSELLDYVEEQDKVLSAKGVHMLLIRVRAGMALIYVYREQQLRDLLARPAIQKFLSRYGYSRFDTESCLAVLTDRLQGEEFPHDIGIFLGYPLSDVEAFIDRKGVGCPCVGCWKAYTNLDEARRTFAKYKKCTRIYCKHFFEGADISRLTVAG